MKTYINETPGQISLTFATGATQTNLTIDVGAEFTFDDAEENGAEITALLEQNGATLKE